MDDNRLKGLAGLAGLALVGTVGAGAAVGSNSAAQDLRPQAVRALTAANLADVRVDFEGREAKLTGGESSERIRAVSVVEAIKGVRWATFASKPATPPERTHSAPAMRFSRSDMGATISGVVPSAEAAASVKTAAAEASGGTVSGDFTIDPSVGSADWVTEMPEIFGDLAGVKMLEIGIGEGSIQLGGSIESQVGADKIGALVSAAVPYLAVDNAITVDAGTLDSEDAETLNTATLYFSRGSATLSTDSTAVLDEVADVMMRNVGMDIEADGHAGPADPVRGRALSRARIAAVRAYLLRAGVDADRVTVESFATGEGTTADVFAKRYRRIDFAVEGN